MMRSFNKITYKSRKDNGLFKRRKRTQEEEGKGIKQAASEKGDEGQGTKQAQSEKGEEGQGKKQTQS